MTYPKADQGGGAEGRRRCAGKREQAHGRPRCRDRRCGERPRLQNALAAMQKEVAIAKGNLDKFKGEETVLVGLEKPLFELRNPGLISIPLGFLAVILGSLLYRDKRAEDMWDELYVRQNTGILAAKAAAHWRDAGPGSRTSAPGGGFRSPQSSRLPHCWGCRRERRARVARRSDARVPPPPRAVQPDDGRRARVPDSAAQARLFRAGPRRSCRPQTGAVEPSAHRPARARRQPPRRSARGTGAARWVPAKCFPVGALSAGGAPTQALSTPPRTRSATCSRATTSSSCGGARPSSSASARRRSPKR